MHMYYNDRLIEDGGIPWSSPGFQYGIGVFETLLFKQGHSYFMEEHCRRLHKGFEKLGLKGIIDEDELYGKAAMLGNQNRIVQGRLKLICFRDTDQSSLIMTLVPYEPDHQMTQGGARLCISEIKRNPYSSLTYMKSMNYADNIMAREEAQRKGFHEALLLNVLGKLCEGAMSNLFWIKKGTVYTPDIGCGLLAGITRQKVVGLAVRLGMQLKEGNFELAELLAAEEVFITNSLMGIVPVERIEDRVFEAEGFIHTGSLRKAYERLLKRDLEEKARRRTEDMNSIVLHENTIT
jgi:branched-subunit amino acid aminotransferase/4-amino-4-deoxychorismate lyase